MSPQDRPDACTDAAALRGRRILIVEDELLVAFETQTLVTRIGAIVVGPYSRVAAALDAVRTLPVDAALLDVNLAGTQSFVIADALQERGIPFVFCTGYERDTVPPRFKNVDLVEKPMLPEAVIAALAEAVKTRAQS